jgi:hypothetical protein
MTAGLLFLAVARISIESHAAGLAGLAGLVVTILLFAPLGKLLYVFLTLHPITLIAVGLLFGFFILICVTIMNLALPFARWQPAVLSLLAAGLISLGIGISSSHHTKEHPRRDTIVYSLNADDHTAVWISFDRSIDDWTAQFFQRRRLESQPAPNYLGGSQRRVLSTSALSQNLAPPIADIEADDKRGDIHQVKLNIRSPRNASSIYVKFDADVRPLSVRVGGREVALRYGAGPASINLYGVDAQGIELDLTLQTRSGVSFWLLDHSIGLPIKAQPRPSNVMAGDGSDITLVCRRYSL